ncbi:uncharacterized protein LOC122668521 [Telopea speciosissima]|uniref:uncharacterized protein LOC122668521 n=1 Tax=Telopea speciosissima TaxID=54955 RepID=UPI001CC36EE2|nr:uncharacterized protein LOC122668521 [Telopea speciosissima]
MAVLHYDGSLTSDRASYGGLIRNAMGVPILAYVGKREEASILSMELLAIYRGISLCLEKDIQNISIRFDSKLAVDILNGTITCPWSVYVLKCRITVFLDQLPHKEIRHVWRELNQPTYFIASIDNGDGESIIYPLDFPGDLLGLIQNDAVRKTHFRPP